VNPRLCSPDKRQGNDNIAFIRKRNLSAVEPYLTSVKSDYSPTRMIIKESIFKEEGPSNRNLPAFLELYPKIR
jgi:hypothetical protein